MPRPGTVPGPLADAVELVDAVEIADAVAPFPVQPPYRVRADLQRLDAPCAADDGPRSCTRLDRARPRYLRRRLERLRADRAAVLAVDERCAPELLHRVGSALARRLETEARGLLVVERDELVLPGLGVRLLADGGIERLAVGAPADPDEATARELRAELAARPPHLRRLEALMATFQEDLVLISSDDRASYLHVSFPSGWDPGTKAGASFAAFHHPVPHATALLRAAPGLVRAMVHKGPFLRFVWGVTPSGDLDRHPRGRACGWRPGSVVEQGYLRVERQTTVPLADHGLGAFLIRVYLAPLREVVADADRRRCLHDAVASMDDALRRYKGLSGVVDRLLRELQDA